MGDQLWAPRTAPQAADVAADAVGNACDPGYCLKYSRTAYGIPSQHSDAADAWHAAYGRHPGDTTPPVGAPVFWTGGSSGHGHIAVYAGDGRIYTTDLPTYGRIGVDDLDAPRTRWGLTYAGWAEGFNSHWIEPLSAQPTPEDDDPMPAYKRLQSRTRRDVSPGEWHAVQFDADDPDTKAFSIVADGHYSYSGSLTLELDLDAAGPVVAGIRLAEYAKGDPYTMEERYAQLTPRLDYPAGLSTVSLAGACVGYANPENPYLRTMVYASGSTLTGVTVTRADACALWWPGK